ncbi:MAG TPA: ATP-binding protein, partial [Gammaproteobacteria bacterium]
MLNNLLSNAVKFTEQGGIGLAVTPASGDAATPLLHFAVTDTGIGIAEADQARIFDAFTQADGSTTRRFGGTGLGLTISTQLVGAMGGRIGVESAPGRGSTFWFTLPLREAEVAEPPTALPGLAGSNVLVVDPQPQQRQYLVQRLQDWGCRVTAVAEAADAEASARAALAEARPFTLAVIADVLTDQVAVALPAALRALLPGLPTILVSPAGKACQEVAANVLGYDACLTRPLRRSQLQNCLLDLLGLP